MKSHSVFTFALALVALVPVVRAVTLDEADPAGSSSFTEGMRWSDGLVPSSEKEYYVFLGADKYLRAPEQHDVLSTTSTWPGGPLTIGSDSKEGWLYVPIYSGTPTSEPQKTWYPRVNVADLRLVKGGLVEPYRMWSGINGLITFAAAEPIEFRLGGTIPARTSPAQNTWDAFYLSAKLVGETNQVLRLVNTQPDHQQAVFMTEDNSGFKGQFVFDRVVPVESCVYSGWAEAGSLNANRYGGDPGYFRADALYFPHGMRLGRISQVEPQINENRATAIIGHPNRGITFVGGGTIGGYISNRTRVNMKLTGDVLTIDSGINLNDFGFSGGYIYLEKTPDVESVKFAAGHFPRLIFGPEVADVTHFPISLTNANSCAVGAAGTCRMRVDMNEKAYIDVRQNSDSTDMGHVIIDERSTIVPPLKVLMGGLPVRGLKGIFPILTVPDTLVTEADIQLLGTGTGQPVTNPYEIKHENGYYTLFVSPQPGTIHYVVPEGTPGNTPTAPYDTWETAANSIQAAVDSATAGSGITSGHQVFIAPGVYPISSTLLVEKYIHLRSCDRETGALAPEMTILDGGYPARTNRIMKLTNAQVSGLTFRNGATTAKDYYNSYAPGGGAINVKNGNTDWSIKNCIFRNNRSINCAGGALTQFSNSHDKMLVFDTLFEGNVAENGNGGAYGANQSNGYHDGMTFTNCTFVGNRATGTGKGGVAYNGRAHYFYNCTFRDNDAAGGYDVAAGSFMRIFNCTIENTVATSHYLFYANASLFRNNVFRNISSTSALVFMDGHGDESGNLTAEFTNCIFTNLTASAILTGQNVGRTLPITQCLVQNCNLKTVFGWHVIGFIFNQCTIAGNNLDTTGEWEYQPRVSTINNSIFWDNVYPAGQNTYEQYLAANIDAAALVVLAVTNSITQALPASRVAKQNAWSQAPGFRAPTVVDCHLHPGAFACDLARETPGLDYDLDGNPRRVDPRGKATPSALPDLGCYECQQPRGGGFTIFFD